MTDQTWDLERARRLRAAMSDADLDALRRKEAEDSTSLTIDEAGVLFLATRERIAALERKAQDKKGQ